MSVIERIEGMSVDEFMRLYDQEGPFELLNGKRVPMSPNMRKHTLTSYALFTPLDTYCKAHRLGKVFYEATFVLSDGPNWVKGSRQPDVLFIEAARYAKAIENVDKEDDGPFVFIPNLTVEIVSPTDRMSEVLEKVALYLADGVTLVWVINRKSHDVTVFRDETSAKVIDRNGTLDGEDVIPGFSLPVAVLFDWEQEGADQ